MVYNDTDTKQGLIQDCEMSVFNEYGKISENTNLLFDFTNRLNRAYDKAVTLMYQADGRHQADDTSYTTTIVNTTTLTSGQYAYTQDAEHLLVLGMRVKDQSGLWHDLTVVDRNDQVKPEFGVSSGLPTHYDKEGDQIKLYPTPNFTQSESLEITVQRVPNYFLYTDTAKSAGIMQTHHRFLSLEASFDYATDNMLANAKGLQLKLDDARALLVQSYSRRNKDEKGRLSIAVQSTR